MQELREIAQRRESSAMSTRSQQQLSVVATTAFDLSLMRMAAHYPHQELGEMTADVYREAFRELAQRHGVATLEQAFAALRLKPGQKFFPHPTEVAEELEAMKEAKSQEDVKAHPYTPCNRRDLMHNGAHAECHDGLMLYKENGYNIAQVCECKRQWRRERNENF